MKFAEPWSLVPQNKFWLNYVTGLPNVYIFVKKKCFKMHKIIIYLYCRYDSFNIQLAEGKEEEKTKSGSPGLRLLGERRAGEFSRKWGLLTE